MGSHDPFRYLKHKLWPKEGLRLKLPIWFPTTKSQESPWFIFFQVACHIPLESSQQGIQLFSKPHLNRRFTKENMGLQSCGSPNFGNFGIPNLGVPRQNDIWVQTCGHAHNSIRGKVVVFPKFRPCWFFWIYVCSWFVCAPKVLKLHTSQLVVWFVQVHVNNWPTCHSSTPHLGASTWPSSVASHRMYPNSLSFRCFHL
jgi:hypothetical protein